MPRYCILCQGFSWHQQYISLWQCQHHHHYAPCWLVWVITPLHNPQSPTACFICADTPPSHDKGYKESPLAVFLCPSFCNVIVCLFFNLTSSGFLLFLTLLLDSNCSLRLKNHGEQHSQSKVSFQHFNTDMSVLSTKHIYFLPHSVPRHHAIIWNFPYPVQYKYIHSHGYTLSSIATCPNIDCYHHPCHLSLKVMLFNITKDFMSRIVFIIVIHGYYCLYINML